MLRKHSIVDAMSKHSQTLWRISYGDPITAIHSHEGQLVVFGTCMGKLGLLVENQEKKEEILGRSSEKSLDFQQIIIQDAADEGVRCLFTDGGLIYSTIGDIFGEVREKKTLFQSLSLSNVSVNRIFS